MNKEMLKKAVANRVVEAAVQTAKMPNNLCFFTFGKPKTKYDLTSDDYDSLEAFVKQR